MFFRLVVQDLRHLRSVGRSDFNQAPRPEVFDFYRESVAFGYFKQVRHFRIDATSKAVDSPELLTPLVLVLLSEAVEFSNVLVEPGFVCRPEYLFFEEFDAGNEPVFKHDVLTDQLRSPYVFQFSFLLLLVELVNDALEYVYAVL